MKKETSVPSAPLRSRFFPQKGVFRPSSLLETFMTEAEETIAILTREFARRLQMESLVPPWANTLDAVIIALGVYNEHLAKSLEK